MSLRNCFIVTFFFIFSSFYSQEPKPGDALGQRVVIGFPEISTSQLHEIKNELLNYSQIATAKYFGKNHGCVLFTFNGNSGELIVYADLLKRLSPFYDVDKCYFKVDEAFDEISNNTKEDHIFNLK